jgi:hypothetical protein
MTLNVDNILKDCYSLHEKLNNIISALEKEQAPKTPTTQPPQLQPQPQPKQPEATKKQDNKTIEQVRMLFSEELDELLSYEDKGDYIRIQPKRFLGAENFARIANVVRNNAGEYISAGKDSHFRICKQGGN